MPNNVISGSKLCCLLSVFLSSSFFASAVLAQEVRTAPGIEELLNKFVDNGAHQLFEGTFIYLFEDAVQTIKVHRKTNKQGIVQEEFIPLDSLKQQTRRLLTNHYCSLDNAWHYQFQAISSSFPFRINNHYQDLQKNYHFSLIENVSVAGVPALGLAIKARDNYRYGYELWFEPETATLLKYKLIGQNKNVIEQYMFTNIAFVKQIKSDNAGKHTSTAQTEAIKSCEEKFQGLSAEFKHYFKQNKIPQGYTPVSFRKAVISNSSSHSEHTAYQFQLSDGIASVSIFIEQIAEPLSEPRSKQPSSKREGSEQKGEAKKRVNGVLKLGPVSVAGKTIGNHQITVLGAIPVSSAMHFLDAVKRPKEEPEI